MIWKALPLAVTGARAAALALIASSGAEGEEARAGRTDGDVKATPRGVRARRSAGRVDRCHEWEEWEERGEPLLLVLFVRNFLRLLILFNISLSFTGRECLHGAARERESAQRSGGKPATQHSAALSRPV